VPRGPPEDTWYLISPRNKQLVVRLCLGAAFVAAAVWAAGKVDWRLVAAQLRAADLGSILLMAGAWIVALCIRPFRTMVLARCLGPETPVRYAPFWTANIASLAVNSIVPMRAGDVVMAVILNRSLGTTAPVSVSIVLFDRFFEFATVIVIFATALLLVPAAVPWMHGVAGVLVPAVVVLSAGMWLVIRLRNTWLRLFDGLVARFSPQRADRWRGPLRDLVEGFARIESGRTIALVVGLSVAQWLAIASSWWFGLVGVWPSAGFAAAAFAASVVALSSIVPLVPGGVGVVQGAAILALSMFGLPAEPSLALAIVLHAVQAGVVLVLGAIALASEGIGLGSLASMRRGD
jgi:uncharacterized protein (TIRG00374 family)